MVYKYKDRNMTAISIDYRSFLSLLDSPMHNCKLNSKSSGVMQNVHNTLAHLTNKPLKAWFEGFIFYTSLAILLLYAIHSFPQ